MFGIRQDEAEYPLPHHVFSRLVSEARRVGRFCLCAKAAAQACIPIEVAASRVELGATYGVIMQGFEASAVRILTAISMASRELNGLPGICSAI